MQVRNTWRIRKKISHEWQYVEKRKVLMMKRMPQELHDEEVTKLLQEKQTIKTSEGYAGYKWEIKKKRHEEASRNVVASVTAIEMDLQFSEKTLNQMNPPSKYSETEKIQK